MSIELYDHQKKALEKLKTGSILRGGVGSGKSLVSLTYYFEKECKGSIQNNIFIPMKYPKDLYIITTARKRDTLEWERELSPFLLSTNKDVSFKKTKVVVDSWNNISKYVNVEKSFFIFDEQRVVGSGAWVKAFLKITKKNNWILLSATPGDTWMDYMPVFIANGFYKNKTEFIRRHVVYSQYSKFPKVDRYIECGLLMRFKNQITVDMVYNKSTNSHYKDIIIPFDKEAENKVLIKRWNIYKNEPIKNASEMCYILRKITNSDYRRIDTLIKIYEEHSKIIIFYNFDYELAMLQDMAISLNINYGEWNGHRHDPIPETEKWVYLVQYTAGAEGWNCIQTNVIVFYSQNYSYKITTQAAGRIDRINTKFKDLYYYRLKSNSKIDLAISKSLKNKKDFNINNFIKK